MKKMMVMLVMVILFFVSGCAPYLRNGYWVNDNVSYEQFLKDYSECRIKTIQVANVFPKIQKDILMCMESKDYYWQTGIPGTLITGDDGWTLLKRNVQLTHAQNIAQVKEVPDGDTLRLANGEYVRLIGVDTPETKHPQKPVERFGREASQFTKQMVEGKEVRLEYDQTRRDRFGRILAYVYLLDGTFLNAEIIKQGYGFAYTKYPFKYMEEFRKYERGARENGRGLWQERY